MPRKKFVHSRPEPLHIAGPSRWDGKQTAMQATEDSAGTRHAATEPPQFPPLELENRPIVPTEQAAFYLTRRPQTLRGWACAETFPDGLRPVRINGRLGWPVAGIRAVLGMKGA